MVRKRSLSKPKANQATIENPFSLFFPDDVQNKGPGPLPAHYRGRSPARVQHADRSLLLASDLPPDHARHAALEVECI